MRFAIISDIHGNLPALELVLEDAEKNKVDTYIFVGDYFLSNPYPNECMDRIRAIDNKYIIRGNEEAYLENLVGKNQNTWTDGQMQISYYCYRAVSEDNLKYVLSLPHMIHLKIHGIKVFIAHSSVNFIDDCEHNEWGPAKFVTKYKDTKITLESLQNNIHEYFEHDETCLSVVKQLETGVYIFGHSHIQWSWQSKDNKITLINPGSCGLPLDGIKHSIPYSILEITENGQVTVEDKRIPFPMEDYIDTLKRSDQYEKANIWSKIIIKELSSGMEHLYFFLRFVEEYANQIGDIRRPFAVDTWEKAYELWEKEY
ncbi:MAG: metallophosphoesterase family protein [Lachnospiraceae bacterium]|nr:metallophosphoesterase family protein [Lachnospiraceae bacterium]